MATKQKVAQPDTEPDAAADTPAAARISSPDPVDSEPVVRISTKKTRPTVEIDEKFYDLKIMGDFGIAKQQSLSRDGREFAGLWNSETELTDDQGKRLKQLLERMYADVLDAPKTVKARLDDSEKAEVVLSFTLAPVRAAMAKMLAEQVKAEQEAEKVEAGDSPSISTS